jgi:hypothetical protein
MTPEQLSALTDWIEAYLTEDRTPLPADRKHYEQVLAALRACGVENPESLLLTPGEIYVQRIKAGAD